MFKDVIGQTEVKSRLVDLIVFNRLSHALLFSAREGAGGLPMALALAQYIVCDKVSRSLAPPMNSLFGDVEETPAAILRDACGECNPCKKSAGLVHPDIHFSYPVVPKKSGDKPVSTDFISEWREFMGQLPYGNVYDWLQFIGAENKQGNITASECNDIIHKLSLKSFESEYKILILWMPEYLGNEGNKLLKLIEEPPANTLFILVTENESLVLPTILSRTQVVRIPPLHAADIEEHLLAKADIPVNQARQIASVSSGNLREAAQLLQHAGEDWLVLLREWLNAIMKSGPIAQVKWIEEMSKQGREKQKQFLKYTNHMLGQAIKLQLLDGATLPLPDNEREFAARFNKLAGLEQLHAIIQELDKAAYYIERNANPKMLFHALTIRLYHIIADKSVILTL
jgi:DNA polymerase III subunit delta'